MQKTCPRNSDATASECGGKSLQKACDEGPLRGVPLSESVSLSART